MSNSTRHIRKRIKARIDSDAHALAINDVRGWEREKKSHFFLAVQRLRHAGMKQMQAELAAYKVLKAAADEARKPA